jgi:SseB protein N-terminal domain
MTLRTTPAVGGRGSGDTRVTIVSGVSAARPAGQHAADAAVERAFAAAVSDTGRIADLLERLSRGRLWLPLADDGQPVTDGSAVNLPTLVYLGSEFVPGYTSADRLLQSAWAGQEPQTAVVPHIVVPAGALARLLPAAVGIAVNPGAEESVPIYPDGVAYLAAPRAGGVTEPVSVGPPPAEPAGLLAAIRFGLRQVRAAREAATAWLSVESAGQGLVISVALDDPGDPAAQHAVLEVVELAARAAPAESGFPIDVTFPGEGEPDLVDQWVASTAAPFYSRA